MKKIFNLEKKLILLLFSALILTGCPMTKSVSVEKSPDISIDENTEAVDSDDEEYDSSVNASQDSDKL